MFWFIEKVFTGLLGVCTLAVFSGSLPSNYKEPIKCVSDHVKVDLSSSKSTLVDINSNKTLFYPFTGSVNKYGGSCNNIDDPYARACVPNKVKNMNVIVFNLMSGINETKYLVQHESCEYECRLNES